MTEFNQPLTLSSGVILPNRIMMAPMTTTQSFYNGVVTQDEITYYAERSKGVGAVITGAANVENIGKGWQGELGIFHDKIIPRLEELALAIQKQGAKAIVQIFHAGRMTNKAVLAGKQPVAPSAIAAERPNAEIPREMSDEEINKAIKAFGNAAHRAIQAGFDGIELHGANTYLIQQFFSPHSNRRTDKWGGSLEKRFTFIKELLDEVFQTVAKHSSRPFAVGYRLSPEEFEHPGIRFEDTLFLLDNLKQTKLDYLHLSLDRYARVAVSDKYKEKSILQYVHEAIEGKIPLVGVGGIRNKKDLQNVLAYAELAAVGQQLIVDPAWAVKLLDGKEKDFVTGDFAKEIYNVKLSAPLMDFMMERYKSIVNV